MNKLPYEQNSLFSIANAEKEPELIVRQSPKDAIGCCSRYRQCSDAKRCLIPNLDYSSDCIYRKNLESGQIFYGKNSIMFSSSKYAEILQRIEKLAPDVRVAFDALVIDFCEYRRGVRNLIVRNVHIKQLSSVGIFKFGKLGAQFPQMCGYRSYLLPIFNNTPLFEHAKAVRASEFARLRNAKSVAHKRGELEEEKRLNNELRELYKKKPNEKSKEFLYDWLNSDAVQLRDILASHYCSASIYAGNEIYLEEFYQDFCLSNYDGRIYTQSPLVADKVLPLSDCVEEEVRRVKLSRGYTQEEKERLLSAVQHGDFSRADDLVDDDAIKDSLGSAEKSRQARKAEIQNPFWGNVCVITGVLSVPRTQAFFDILKCGGKVSDGSVASMDILIVGRQEWSERNNGLASSKLQKAAELRNQGKDILILSEDEFYSIVGQLCSSVN